MKKFLSLAVVCIFLLSVFTLAIGCTQSVEYSEQITNNDTACAEQISSTLAIEATSNGEYAKRVSSTFAPRQSLGDLTVIMYHNTLAPNKKESVYCINQDSLHADFEYLKVHGYNVVAPSQVINTVLAGRNLPDKAVMLTFDDGYLNNLRYAVPLLEEYGYTGLFSVVGDYTQFNKDNTSKYSDFIYFDWDDIASADGNKLVEIGLHSYSLHYTKPRKGVASLAEREQRNIRVCLQTIRTGLSLR